MAQKLFRPWKHVMMCYPRYFDVTHHFLNAHMTKAKPIFVTLAQRQWRNLVETLEEYNVKIELILPQPGMLDMVFTASAGIIHGNKAVVANFGVESRTAESRYYKTFFKELGFEVIDPADANIHIEGCADFMSLYDRTHHFVSAETYPYIKDVFGISRDQLTPLKLVNKYFYHIDTCLMSLSRGHLMYFPEAFSEEGLKQIKDIGGDKCLEVSEEDASYFACNSINFENEGEHVIIGNRFSDKLNKILTERGYKVIETPFTEYLFSGGSARCSVLDIGRAQPTPSQIQRQIENTYIPLTQLQIFQ